MIGLGLNITNNLFGKSAITSETLWAAYKARVEAITDGYVENKSQFTTYTDYLLNNG